MEQSAHPQISLGKIIAAELIAAGIVVALLALWQIRHLGLEVLVAAIAAVILEPLVRLLIRLHVPRVLAVAVAVIAVTGAIVLILFAFSVPLYDAGVRLVNELPKLLRQVQDKRGKITLLLNQLHLTHVINVSAQQLAQLAQKAIAPAVVAARGVVSFLEAVVITATLAVFFSLETPSALRWIFGTLPVDRAERLRGALKETARAMSGYVLGNLATSIIAGLVVYLTFRSLGIPFAFLVAVWVGLVDFIPLVGGLLAGIPSVGLALLTSTEAAIIVLVVFIVYQQIENHLLNPIILGRTVRLNPLWILLAVLIGAQLAQLVGALVAIPVASALQVLSRQLVDEPLRAWMSRRRSDLTLPGD
ncbi:MAG: AI-2E family transporter [Ferrimicrobium sp.]